MQIIAKNVVKMANEPRAVADKWMTYLTESSHQTHREFKNSHEFSNKMLDDFQAKGQVAAWELDASQTADALANMTNGLRIYYHALDAHDRRTRDVAWINLVADLGLLTAAIAGLNHVYAGIMAAAGWVVGFALHIGGYPTWNALNSSAKEVSHFLSAVTDPHLHDVKTWGISSHRFSIPAEIAAKYGDTEPLPELEPYYKRRGHYQHHLRLHFIVRRSFDGTLQSAIFSHVDYEYQSFRD